MFGLELYYLAWFDLDSERTVGFGLGPIPRSAMVGYAKDMGLTSEQTEDLCYLVREMDNDYLKRQHKKGTKGGKDGQKDASGPSERSS